MKLVKAIPMVTFLLLTATAGVVLAKSSLYSILDKHSRWADIVELEGSIDPASAGMDSSHVSGAYIRDGIKFFMWIVQYYTALKLWLPFLQWFKRQLLCALFLDGRRVWGKNELAALVFKVVQNCQSPVNVWPLMMLKTMLGETFKLLGTIEAHVGFGKIREALHNRVSTTDFSSLFFFFKKKKKNLDMEFST